MSALSQAGRAAAAQAAAADSGVGLTSAQARALLEQCARNVIEHKQAPSWQQFLRKLWAPVPWMLETVIVLQLLLGRHTEAAVMVALLVFNATVGFAQERRARNALELLRKRLPVRARVRRDGTWWQIFAAELVPGDVVHLRAGDLVPADLKLLDGVVALDQSGLTGVLEMLGACVLFALLLDTLKSPLFHRFAIV